MPNSIKVSIIYRNNVFGLCHSPQYDISNYGCNNSILFHCKSNEHCHKFNTCLLFLLYRWSNSSFYAFSPLYHNSGKVSNLRHQEELSHFVPSLLHWDLKDWSCLDARKILYFAPPLLYPIVIRGVNHVKMPTQPSILLPITNLPYQTFSSFFFLDFTRDPRQDWIHFDWSRLWSTNTIIAFSFLHKHMQYSYLSPLVASLCFSCQLGVAP